MPGKWGGKWGPRPGSSSRTMWPETGYSAPSCSALSPNCPVCEKWLCVPGARRGWIVGWSQQGRPERAAASSPRVPSCSCRQRGAACGLLVHKPEQDARPTPCPLLVESASAGASHQDCVTCCLLVFYGLFPLPECSCIPQLVLNHTPNWFTGLFSLTQ